MKNLLLILLLLVVTVINQSWQQSNTMSKRAKVYNDWRYGRCQKSKNGQYVCRCGKDQLVYDLGRGETCRNGKIIRQKDKKTDKPNIAGLRSSFSALHRSTREDKTHVGCPSLRISDSKAFVPLRNVSVETWIHTFAADVTLTQVYVNQEENPIEAIYVFPIEENAAIYAFTAEIDGRLITAVLKEKKLAEAEYDKAVQQGQTSVLLRQSGQTLDTFKVNVGVLPPGKECIIKIQYVTELDLVDGNSIRFVVPTTVAPRYNPQLGGLQSSDSTQAEYAQNTSYSMSFQAHIDRGTQNKIMQVANRSHPVNVSMSRHTIDVSSEGLALDRDIILDIDLPPTRSSILIAAEKYDNLTKHAILTALNPDLSRFVTLFNEKNETENEIIFIVDCSGSMDGDDKIELARQAMLLFVRSLPVGSHFNIIRFGSNYEVLFKNEMMTDVYGEQTAKQAEDLSRSMEADLGGTELLQPLQYLKDHPPRQGRSRQVFLLTDGEVSNTDQVIELSRSMSSTTRIFSFGLGHSPSRSLVKGLARATNGHFVFVPPNSKVDTYVGGQLRRALQPSLADAELEWQGLSSKGLQSPGKIPSVYSNDRVLVYTLLENIGIDIESARVNFLIGKQKIGTAKLSDSITYKGDTIRRLAAKALIQELQHADDDSTLEQRITTLSLTHQILSPYTAFVGVETKNTKFNGTPSQVRHIPIQISKGDEHLSGWRKSMSQFSRQGYRTNTFAGGRGPIGFSMGMSADADVTAMHSENSDSQDDGDIYSSLDSDSDGSMSIITTTSSPLIADPVRWLIEEQSFNGTWILNDDQVQQLTKGKTLNTFNSTISKNKNIITTAITIALLESKYADQQDLWYMVVEKGRQQLLNFGLSKDKIHLLINEMKSKV